MITDCVDGQGAGDRRPDASPVARARAPRRSRACAGSAASTTRAAAPAAAVDAAFDSTQDIDFDHEAELTRVAASSCSRPTSAAAASCRPARPARPASTTRSATAASTPTAPTPEDDARRPRAEEAFDAYARDARGRQGDLPRPDPHPAAGRRSAPPTSSTRSPARTGSSWAGTRRAPRWSTSSRTPTARSSFKEAGYFIPANANTWVSHVFKAAAATPTARSPTGAPPATSTSATPGRNAIDVYKVTLPAPPARGPARARPAPPRSPPGPLQRPSAATTVANFTVTAERRRARGGLGSNFAPPSSRSVQDERLPPGRGGAGSRSSSASEHPLARR